MAKLVAIGDSLTQGFASGAITNTDLSYPAMIADAMGLDVTTFRRPNFRGSGGLPCNLEWLARRLEERFGYNVAGFEWLRSIPTIQSLLDEVEDYWERGKGTQVEKPVLYHNLAVWGFETADAYNVTAGVCEERAKDKKDDWFAIPSEPRSRTAYKVLNPAQDNKRKSATQISVAQDIADAENGIEHLILFMGANNCLGTVLELEVRETGDVPPGAFTNYTLWSEKAFEAEYTGLIDRVLKLKAKNVYVATVPHVTIPPITRGIMENRGRLPDDKTYFDYYTRFWIKDKDFDPERDPCLSGEEASEIDARIDKYNAFIRHAAANNPNWHLVDLCDVLDRLAIRRNHGKVAYPLPPAISDLGVRFFELEPGRTVRADSGIFSLDGIHPTTCGYGIIAQEFINVIKTTGESIRNIDFADIRRWDTLVTAPPMTLDDMFGMLETLEKFFHFSRWYGKPIPQVIKAVLGEAEKPKKRTK